MVSIYNILPDITVNLINAWCDVIELCVVSTKEQQFTERCLLIPTYLYLSFLSRKVDTRKSEFLRFRDENKAWIIRNWPALSLNGCKSKNFSPQNW